MPLLFSDEEDTGVPSGVKPVDLKVDNARASPEVGSTDAASVAQKVSCTHGFPIHWNTWNTFLPFPTLRMLLHK